MIHEDEPLQPAHISYKDYKKLVNRNPRQSFIMFVSVFCVLLIVFLGFAKVMSPDVEISIGDDSVEEELVKPGEIDSRLKEIHMEDNSEALGGEGFAIQDGGKVLIPKQKNVQQDQDLPAEEDSIYLEEEQPQSIKFKAQEKNDIVKSEQKSEPKPGQKPEAAPIPQAVNAKVVVGTYTTVEQAEVAKGILQDAGLGLAPFIRKIGGEYTLQVGSFNSKEKAMNAAKDLLIKNYPARVLIEQ